MKIGFDVSQTAGAKAGCGYFADGLIVGLSEVDSQNQYSLYSTFGDHFWSPDYKQTRQISLPNFQTHKPHHTLLEAKSFWAQSPELIEKALGSPDIIHSNNFFSPPRLPKTKVVYTLYDLSFLDHPEWTTEANRLACFNGVLSASLDADYLIAISEYSKQHFLNRFPHCDARKISVVYPASRYEGFSILAKKPKRFNFLFENQFWLNVGTIEPRKNQEGLLRAYATLKKEKKSVFPIAIAGGKGWLIENFNQLIVELGLEKDVFVLGYVSDEELLWLYQNTFSLVYPSFFEGFGLPPVEALNFGKPVIASNTSSLPEVVGKAGILVDPYDQHALTDAMFSLENSAGLYKQLAAEAKQQAARFSWEKSARQLKAIYKAL